MRTLLAAAAMACALCAPARAADDAGLNAARCLTAASASYRVPLGVLLILLRVEGGSLGHTSQNTNETVDIGPMQINSSWLPKVAAHWRAAPSAAFVALRDQFCANVEAGAWILRQALDEAHGDLWEGVGLYHSHDPGYKRDYLQKVLRVALRLQARAAKAVVVARN